MTPDLEERLKKFSEGCDGIYQNLTYKSNDILYKYATYKSLENILEKKKLWNTNYRFFNDSTEILFGKRIVKEILMNVNIPTPHRDVFLRVINKIFDEFDNFYQIYVGCFSKSINNLALWRYYACDGTGFAIGFNKKFQDSFLKNTALKGKVGSFSVVYGKKDSEKNIREFVDPYERILNEVAFDEQNIDFFKKLASCLASHLIASLPVFKDESFKDENEVRIILIEGKLIIDPSTGKPFYFEDSLRDFIPIDTPSYPFVKKVDGNKPVILPSEFSTDDISEIWIGPCCEFIEARTAIRRLLRENRYDVDKIKIERAKFPYQNI